MTLKRLLVLNCVAAALAASAGDAAAATAVRSACTPSPAGGEVVSQVSDALSTHLDAAHLAAIANWDVRWWQRHRVWIALDASNGGDAVAHVLPQVVVDAQASGGVAQSLVGLPMTVAPHAHATQRLSIYVPDDARTLGVRTLLAAPAQPVAVAFALECSESRFDTGEFSPAAAPLVDEALRTYFGQFIDPLADPKAALEMARALSSGVQDGNDVAWVLRGLMQFVHDEHGYVLAPGEPVPVRRVLATRAPEFELRTDGVAIVRLHAVDTTSDGVALAWAGALHDGIASLAAQHPRAWIVDLRDHDADAPWPALAALSALLDGPAVGAFVNRQGQQGWIADRGSARIAGGPALVDLQSPPEPTFRGPVAVLIGPGTRNAGEDVAVAFRGRAHTRFLGAATAGFPLQGVGVHRLSDGTTMGVLETRDVDRTGVVHRIPVEPDAVLRPEAAAAPVPQPALDWIEDERAAAMERR